MMHIAVQSIYKWFTSKNETIISIINVEIGSMETNSSDCFPTVATAKAIASIYSSFAAIATVMYIVAILLIATTRAYKQFIHRLTLYLSFSGLFRALSLWFEVVPVNLEKTPDTSSVEVRDGWNAVCALSGFVVQYSGLLQTSVVVWISLYIFVTVLFPKGNRGHRYEAVGLTTVSLAPLLLSWEPFVTNSYGLWGTICWIKDNPCHSNDTSLQYNRVYALWLVSVPHVVMTQFGLLLMVVAILVLARRLYKKVLKHHHWFAIKEIVPLILYPLVYSFIFFARMIGLSAGNSSTLFGEVSVCFIQLCSIALPVSLIVRANFRRTICHCRTGSREENNELSTAAPLDANYSKF